MTKTKRAPSMKNLDAGMMVAVLMTVGQVRGDVTRADDFVTLQWPPKAAEHEMQLDGLPQSAIDGLKLVAGGAEVGGFVAGADVLSVTTVRVAVPKDASLTTETGRLKAWAYGLLLERFDGAGPLRLGGPLEPFMIRLARATQGRLLVGLTGFVQDGTFCVTAVELQPEQV